MIGLEIRYNKDEVWNVALQGAVGIYIVHRFNAMCFEISGADRTSIYKWLETAKLNVGDEIEVRVRYSVPACFGVRNISKEIGLNPMNDEEIQNMWHEKLMKFYALEKTLSEEGLISE